MWIEVFHFLSFKIQLKCLKEVPGCVARFLHAGNIPLQCVPELPCTSLQQWHLHCDSTCQPPQSDCGLRTGGSHQLSSNLDPMVEIYFLAGALTWAVIPRFQSSIFCLLPWKSQSLKVGGPSGRCWNMLSGSQSKCDY